MLTIGLEVMADTVTLFGSKGTGGESKPLAISHTPINSSHRPPGIVWIRQIRRAENGFDEDGVAEDVSQHPHEEHHPHGSCSRSVVVAAESVGHGWFHLVLRALSPEVLARRDLVLMFR